jgi:CheY-like chemotaxis protein
MRAGTPDGIGLQADPHRPISIGSRLDHDIHECRALVIDGNPTSRSVLTAQLRDFGVGTVVQTGRVKDARSILENRPFDVVLCDYHFDGSDMSGQDLLDELRREQLLPFATVFIMVTGEATDAKVTEAAESALDGSLLKPHTATHLGERIRESRQRKRVLRHIFEAIERGDHGAAAELCQARFEKRAPCWLYAARIGAELYLRLDRHAEAQALYAAVVEARALPWARLGIARTQLASSSREEGGRGGSRRARVDRRGRQRGHGHGSRLQSSRCGPG